MNALVEARVPATDKQKGKSIASFSHEALLRRWDQVTSWFNNNREHLRMRSRIEQSQQRWEESDQIESLLLANGLPLEEGRQLLDTGSLLLTPRAKVDLEESIDYHESNQRRRLRPTRFVFAMLSTFTLAAVIATVIAGSFYSISDTNYSVAKQNAQLANDKTIEAERL